jgi:hypothetical protein
MSADHIFCDMVSPLPHSLSDATDCNFWFCQGKKKEADVIAGRLPASNVSQIT